MGLVYSAARSVESPAMMYLEFVVFGVPISNQVRGPNLDAWRNAVEKEARTRWKNQYSLES